MASIQQHIGLPNPFLLACNKQFNISVEQSFDTPAWQKLIPILQRMDFSYPVLLPHNTRNIKIFHCFNEFISSRGCKAVTNEVWQNNDVGKRCLHLKKHKIFCKLVKLFILPKQIKCYQVQRKCTLVFKITHKCTTYSFFYSFS